jgi:hypothetical protein
MQDDYHLAERCAQGSLILFLRKAAQRLAASSVFGMWKAEDFLRKTKAMDARGDKQDTAADEKIQGYMKQLGTDFQAAWVASEDVDTDTPDGKVVNADLDNLTGKCT